MPRLIFLGPPGSGKGTQADLLAQAFQIPNISTGNKLRAAIQAGTPLGLEAKSYMDRGDLVPDPVLVGIVKDQLSVATEGWILDGFPRTLVQAEALEEMLIALGQHYDCVINLEVPSDELIRRLSNRGENRSDDKADVIQNRLEVYRVQTQPLIDYYRDKRLTPVDGNRPPEVIHAHLKDLVKQAAGA